MDEIKIEFREIRDVNEFFVVSTKFEWFEFVKEAGSLAVTLTIATQTVVVVSPATPKNSKKGLYFSVILDAGSSKAPDHWYGNIYPIGREQVRDELDGLLGAMPGERFKISGKVRKWNLETGGYGVVIDISAASPVESI